MKLTKKNLCRCPVCGKKPKVKYEIYPTQCWCVVRCKPLFKKAHLEVFSIQAGEICDRAEQEAFKAWNEQN